LWIGGLKKVREKKEALTNRKEGFVDLGNLSFLIGFRRDAEGEKEKVSEEGSSPGDHKIGDRCHFLLGGTKEGEGKGRPVRKFRRGELRTPKDPALVEKRELPHTSSGPLFEGEKKRRRKKRKNSKT